MLSKGGSPILMKDYRSGDCGYGQLLPLPASFRWMGNLKRPASDSVCSRAPHSGSSVCVCVWGAGRKGHLCVRII